MRLKGIFEVRIDINENMQKGEYNMCRYKIINAEIIGTDRIIHSGCIVVDGGIITKISTEDIELDNCIIIDAKGYYVSPGFIDIHSHGGGGADFMDGTVEAYIQATETHAVHGTTAIIPTTLTSTNEELKNTFHVYNEAKRKNKKGSKLVGIHLEGPYFSMQQRGAQDPRYIKKPRSEEYKEILSWSDDIIRWSAAPELEGALEFGSYLSSIGILPSIAHSDAVYDEVFKALKNGYTHITHFYSAMSGVKRVNGYRFGGVIESGYLLDDMTVEIIADGAHLPAELLKLIYKIKGPDRIALVTDSMRAAGMPEGESILGSLKDGQKVIVEDGVAKLADRSAFAGSVATADRLVRNMINMAGVPLIDAVKMMTITPAVILGFDKNKGSIEVGKDADIVIFDKNIQVLMTMVEGNVVYEG